MKRRDIVIGMIVGLAFLGASVVAQQSPAAYAAGPTLSVSATHSAITVTGTNFSTSGRIVDLKVYGISGNKTFLTSSSVTPSTTSQPIPPCLFGVLCNAGSFIAPTMAQSADPCYGGGYVHIEVDAWTTGPLGKWYKAASAKSTVTCPITQ